MGDPAAGPPTPAICRWGFLTAAAPPDQGAGHPPTPPPSFLFRLESVAAPALPPRPTEADASRHRLCLTLVAAAAPPDGTGRPVWTSTFTLKQLSDMRVGGCERVGRRESTHGR